VPTAGENDDPAEEIRPKRPEVEMEVVPNRNWRSHHANELSRETQCAPSDEASPTRASPMKHTTPNFFSG
jgi:hypothetical protein